MEHVLMTVNDAFLLVLNVCRSKDTEGKDGRTLDDHVCNVEIQE